MQITKYGLLGGNLSHSFSKKYFEEKFRDNNIHAVYELIELPEEKALRHFMASDAGSYHGLNITIPYKESVIQYLDSLDRTAEETGAVNTIHIAYNKKKGFNTDIIGFRESLSDLISPSTIKNALIFGTGGASKAAAYVLKQYQINFQVASRTPCRQNHIAYNKIKEKYTLWINATPVGQKNFPFKTLPLPENVLPECYYDMVYNPPITPMMKILSTKGVKVKNGREMLKIQAEVAWEIWNSRSSI